MRYRGARAGARSEAVSAAQRLARLERLEAEAQGAQDGDAPAAWARLVLWAVAVRNAGGWAPAVKAWREARLPAPDPYTFWSTGMLWDARSFYERGTAGHAPTDAQRHRILYCIVCAVEQLHEAGMPDREIATWPVGCEVWHAIVTHLEGDPDGAR